MKRVVVVFGLSGTGKSFVARILHEEFGYVWIRSDEIRKELAGISPEQSARAPFGEGIYTEEMTRRVYEEMVRKAEDVIREGKRVVLDATFIKGWQRDLVRARLPDTFFIQTLCDEKEVRRRLSTRVDVSDADFGIYQRQKEVLEKPLGERVVELRTDRPAEEIVSELKDLLEDC